MTVHKSSFMDSLNGFQDQEDTPYDYDDSPSPETLWDRECTGRDIQDCEHEWRPSADGSVCARCLMSDR